MTAAAAAVATAAVGFPPVLMSEPSSASGGGDVGSGPCAAPGAGTDADRHAARRQLLFALRCLELYEENGRTQPPPKMEGAGSRGGAVGAENGCEGQGVDEVVDLTLDDECEAVDIVDLVKNYVPLAGSNLASGPGAAEA